MRKLYFLPLFICLITGPMGLSQHIEWVNDGYSKLNIDDSIAGELTFSLNTSSFVKDNEYFNRMVEGYTLIGFWAEPVANYHLSSQSHIWAGISTVRFFGQKGFYATEPIFGIIHQFNSHVSLTMGSLPYSQHSMPAPLLDPERYYLKRVDNGAQFVVQLPYLLSDTWLSWDRFSFYGDSLQEHISLGSSNHFRIINHNNIEIGIPVYLIVTHKGGQVLRPKQPIETLVNVGTGITFRSHFEKTTIELNASVLSYQKVTSHPSQPFSKGWAFYPALHVEHGKIAWESSWWHGQKFITPLGEKIYSQISTFEVGYTENIRNIYINKIFYQQTFTGGLKANIAFESYYFPSEKRIDYNFWVHLNWNFKRHLLTLKPQVP